MANISISNYVGLADTFTFTYNPMSFDVPFDSDHTTTHIPYTDRNISVSAGGIMPRLLVLSGNFSESSRRANYRSLIKHINENYRLKKLYWESDKFYLCLGKNVKETNQAGRTNFIDYVATLEAVIGILFGNTQRTSGTNDGDITTYLEELTGTVTNGASDITITDNFGNQVTIPNSVLTTSQNFVYKFIAQVYGGGLYVTEYRVVGLEVDSGTTTSDSSYKLVQTGQNFTSTVNEGDLVYNTTDSTWSIVVNVDSDTQLTLLDDIMDNSEAYIIYHQTRSVQTTGGDGFIRIRNGENITTVTTSNITSATKRFRDAFLA